MYFYRTCGARSLVWRVLITAIAVFAALSVLGLVFSLIGFAFHVLGFLLRGALLVAVVAFIWRRVARR